MNSNQDEIQVPVSDNGLEIIKGSALKGIGYGTAIDLGGNLLLGTLYGAVYGLILYSQDVPADEIMARFSSMDHWSSPMLLLTAVSTLVSFYAGYVCAKKSLTNIERNAAILIFISCGISFLMGYEAYSWVENIFFVLLNIAAIFAGSFYWKRKNLQQ